MDPDLMMEIAQEVDAVINSAANTTFDERFLLIFHNCWDIQVHFIYTNGWITQGRFDAAVNINTRGPSRVLDFAKKCKKLCCFIHISTENVVETLNPKSSPLLHPPVDVDAEVKLALDSNLAFHGDEEMARENERNGFRKVQDLENQE
ncbi:fatty acyl-CoA reductase 2, chloroplastic-like [Mangifera indica]|uniref:fatty acyl-CoA reductase 2, chloroplastic-like n=1 Tax=Mangifera indica TaxID=29780 RepID=UPI001CF96F43|nr:fatty acyl-CoA reductase 2, chloroplastic-like [Mangifera indica]